LAGLGKEKGELGKGKGGHRMEVVSALYGLKRTGFCKSKDSRMEGWEGKKEWVSPSPGKKKKPFKKEAAAWYLG